MELVVPAPSRAKTTVGKNSVEITSSARRLSRTDLGHFYFALTEGTQNVASEIEERNNRGCGSSFALCCVDILGSGGGFFLQKVGPRSRRQITEDAILLFG